MYTGIGEDYLLWSWDYLATWRDLLRKAERWNFNTFRLSFRFPEAPATTHSLLDYKKLNEVLNLLSVHGIKAVLDCHNWRDHYGWFGSDEWINSWVELASVFKGDSRILAYELFNEPCRDTWCPSITSTEGVARAFAKATDAVRQVDSARTVVWADPFDYYGGSVPEDTRRGNVIYAFHGWIDTSNVSAAKMYAFRKAKQMDDWERIYGHGSAWLGEFGTFGEYDWEAQKTFAVTLINRCLESDIGFCWWTYSSNPEVASAVLRSSSYLKPSLIGSLALLVGLGTAFSWLMKSDSGGILRMRHSRVTSKQVPKVVDVGYCCNPPATLFLIPSQLCRESEPAARHRESSRTSFSPFPFRSAQTENINEGELNE